MPSVEITVDIIKRTPMAVLVDDGDVQEWIPLSLIDEEIDEDDNIAVEISIPEWLAIDKGFI